MTPHSDSERHAAPAIPSRLHLRRCRGPGAVLRAARHQPPLRLAHRHGAAGLAARLRRDRRHARQSRAGRRGRLARPVVGARRGGLGADPRHRAQPHGGRCGQRLVGRRAAPRPRQPLRPLVRHRLGGRRQGPAADPRPPARRGPGRGRARARRRCVPLLLPSPARRRRRPGTPALAAGLVAQRRRSHQLAALLRHQRAGLPAHGGARGLRGRPCPAAPPARRGHRRRPAHRSCRWPRRSRRLLPGLARAPQTRRLARGREDPARRREPAGRLGLRRHHRLRLHGRGERPAARRSGRARAGRGLVGAERPARRLCRRGGARPPRDFGAQLRRPARRLRRRPSPVASSAPRCCAACWASCWRISRSIAPTAATACFRPPIAPCSTAPPPARAAPASRPTAGRSIPCCAGSASATAPAASRASSSSARRSPPRRSRTPASIAGAACCRATMSASIPPPSPSTPTPSTAACRCAGPTGRARCWPPPPTTTSAARTCARGSRC